MTEPKFTWCPAPGLSRNTKLVVDTVQYGDGYVHRSTRGINPAQPSWSVSVPFTSQADADAMGEFLKDNAAGGFYYSPPDVSAEIFVVCDEWTISVDDKNKATGIIGTLSATFQRVFNPQPIA